MKLARVAGTVTATKKSDFISAVYLLIEECNQFGVGNGKYLIALDIIGANRGHIVMYAQGSSCRWHSLTENRPIDTLVIGIIDTIDICSRVVYPDDRTMRG